MALILSQLLQGMYRKLGQTETFLATGGSTTTIVNTLFKEKYQDDDLVGWTAFVTRDAGGASAAPENEYKTVTSYVESTWTITVASAFSGTSSVASGDRITLANYRFPLEEMIQQANMMLEDLGDFTLVDTSITTAANKTEYAIPVGLKRNIIKVQIQTNTTDADDNGWDTYNPSEYEVVPATSGSTGLLIFRDQPDSGYSLKVWYSGSHPSVSSYSDVILEYIHPTLAIAGLTAYALDWFNARTAGGDEYWLRKLNDARIEFDIAKQNHKIHKETKRNKLLTLGGSKSNWNIT